MALKASISNISNSIIAVTKTDGRLTSTSPAVTIKNQVNEIRSIEDLGDVIETNVVNGATLVYNSALDKYEVKPIDLGASGLDGGTF